MNTDPREISSSKLVFFSALFLVLFYNLAFFQNVLIVYPFTWENSVFLISLAILFVCINTIVIALFCFKHTTKPVLIAIFLVSSLSAYFMDTYNVIIDDTMIDNIVKTDVGEAVDLISIEQVLYFLILGALPALFIYKIKISEQTLPKLLLSKLKVIGVSLFVAVAIIFSLGNFYASFFREHKSLRFYSNPSYYLYSTVNYAASLFDSGPEELKSIGTDATHTTSTRNRELVIFVVGETARADHFSLNGYARKTNPYLEKEDVINFDDVWACGTSTAYSVPCMFSVYDQASFSKSKARATENVLDVIQRAGVNVLWLDNNSSSKGVADRVPYITYKTPENNPLCDIECRDEGMLENLQTYIDAHPTGDLFIVLHQMGNHGPAYYKRYPKSFERFTPTCKTNQLEQCSKEEINNAYDNGILYTDYFLSKTIKLLKDNQQDFDASMFYVSDHGESLGENNLYLHGLPNMIAPDEQLHVPMIMWFDKAYAKNEIKLRVLIKKSHEKLSHDNLFHTILGLTHVSSKIYDKHMDIIEYKKDG